MGKTEKKAFVAINNTIRSKAVIDYIIDMSLCPEEWHLSLVHILRSPSASEELMGKKFIKEQPARMLDMLEKAKNRLVENGYRPDKIDIKVAQLEYATISEGIIDQYKKEKYDILIIGRKRMSKSEEFVMGDVSIKLIRKLEKAAILVVKD